MAQLDKFKSAIGGGIRPNQFSVELTSNSFADSLGQTDFTFLCHSTEIPGSNIGQAQVFHRGRMIPLAGERTFDPWNVTVYADQNMAIRSLFEDWSNAMNNYTDNTGTTNQAEYKAEGLIKLLDRNNNVIKSWKVVGIFPVNISPMQLSWQQNDVVGEFSITFAVEQFDPFDGSNDSFFKA
jgi:hypothetical protein